MRLLPSRVVVYLLLAGGLFAELGYRQVWARMTAALAGLAPARPSPSALAQACRRIGPAPLRALFDLPRGPASGLSRTGVWWRGRLVCAIDGTILCCPDTPANLTVYRRGAGNHGGTGYPMVRLLTLVACGTRTIIDATFGTDRVGETRYAHDLLAALRAGMIVLADRTFAVRAWIVAVVAVVATGADVLVRVKLNRALPVCRRLRDGSYVSRIGPGRGPGDHRPDHDHHQRGPRSEIYRLVTTVTDPDYPAAEIITLYQQRWGATRGRAC
ncbi:IS4 family transposase [Pseudonocardia sp. MH-G8]|uniref:IS4 family transposase n=1 Tax=Pseudonocardia sp. MH-G8 TaxID=1854588 RepID=UPI001E4DE192|nr:IS4 family transposase [Pseudonocardia sp. MH-G8]